MRFRPPVLLGVTANLLAVVVFASVAIAIRHDGALVDFDREWSARLEVDGETAPRTVALAEVLTFVGGLFAQTVFTILVGAALAVAGFRVPHRRRLFLSLALIWLTAVIGGTLLNTALKDIFQRERPHFSRALTHASSYSFPSGHSMSATVDFGMFAYLLLLVVQQRWQRVTIGAGLALVVLGIGWSRVYLGAHWPADVLGGFAAGVVWLSVCVAASEWRRKMDGA